MHPFTKILSKVNKHLCYVCEKIDSKNDMKRKLSITYKDVVHTLYNNARCLQSPTEMLPTGITTQLKQFLSKLLLDLQRETNSMSSVVAAPLEILFM